MSADTRARAAKPSLCHRHTGAFAPAHRCSCGQASHRALVCCIDELDFCREKFPSHCTSHHKSSWSRQPRMWLPIYVRTFSMCTTASSQTCCLLRESDIIAYCAIPLYVRAFFHGGRERGALVRVVATDEGQVATDTLPTPPHDELIVALVQACRPSSSSSCRHLHGVRT